MEIITKILKKERNLLLRANTGKRLSPAASVTVEASFVMPLFLFFFINLLGSFDVLKLQVDLTAALHQTGSQIMESAGLARQGPGEHDDGFGNLVGKTAITAYADHRLKSYFNENNLSHSIVVGGNNNISLTESALSSNSDIVDLVASCKVHPIFGIAGFTDFGVESRFYGHSFTGYDITDTDSESRDEAEELVYITESGTVYHRSLECSHLRIRIRSVSKGEVKNLRNKDGSKYYPCEYCGGKGSRVYITGYGNRYHSNSNCSGLKRTIKTVPISEVGGRRACSECG